MNVRNRLVAATLALGCSLLALPASAQYANEFTPAKILKEGTTSKPIAGSGLVKIEVQVNADGTHKVVKVDSSTNSGDNAAAIEIAQTSTYKPGHRGSTPVVSFYTFAFKFNGKSYVSQNEGSGISASAGGPIAALIRAQKYAEAKSKAESTLLSNPGDDFVRKLLGVSDFYTQDYASSAAAFDKVATVTKEFKLLAAQAFANAAVQVAQTDPQKAMGYANKAVALDGSFNSKYALGVAQLANKQYADAIATLKAVHEGVFPSPKTAKGVKIGVDTELLQAYVATNDTADAQATEAEIKQIDPTSTAGARVLGNQLLQSASVAEKAKNWDEALKDYDQAGTLGDTLVAVTAYTQAAFAVSMMDKPDYGKMKGYADKAVALGPNDPAANYAEGVALTGQYASNHDDKVKAQAVDALHKADSLAQAAGETSLSLTIETFIKNNIK